MRLWSLHPPYLDAKGLVALWREALLARAVLRGATRGYRHHPQLDRVRAHPAPRQAINAYRAAVHAAWSGFFDAVRAIGESPVPMVAAIAGHAPAGGCVLALCCDYRVMAEGPFRIGLNETQVGLVAPEGIQHLLRRVVGAYRAERMLIAGEMVESARAFEIGLVDELAAIDAVGTRALAWLEALLALPRRPMLRTREIARALHARVRDLPIVSPHGHTDPAWFATDAPFPDPSNLLIVPDHYVLRMLYSQGVPLEALGIARGDGGAVEADPRAIWRRTPATTPSTPLTSSAPCGTSKAKPLGP